MILAYHRVNTLYRKDALSVDTGNFRRQVGYLLQRGFRPISLGEHFEKFHGKKPGRNVCITFDDGFADNLYNALPVLGEMQIKPFIFLTAGLAGTGATLPRYKGGDLDRFLDWSEVDSMLEAGAEFGSHSLTHARLTLLGRDRLDREVSDSKKLIEDKTGREVRYFCYPYGDFNTEVIEAVKRAGYSGACATLPRTERGRINEYIMPRTGVYGHNDFLRFRIKIWTDYAIEKYF